MGSRLTGTILLLGSLILSNQTTNYMFVLIGAIWGATIIIENAIKDVK